MAYPANKTKIVATIGPASASVDTILEMIRAGMDVARLNFSHGNFETHEKNIRMIKEASKRAGRSIAIMADLPGPKIRVGDIEGEPLVLNRGDSVILTTASSKGGGNLIPVTLPTLHRSVKVGDPVFISDGTIQLRVEKIEGQEVFCKVEVGGELTSRKGINLPGTDLGISAFTERDRECLEFALSQGVDAVSQSFVESANDVLALKEEVTRLGKETFVIAKIERARALTQIDEIIRAADGIMVARGDLGVEIPIEEIAVVQKELIRKAMAAGKPVITATQMLESMTEHKRPTRAEATDVANAILDGTDCVMLSAESATGRYPVESVAMLAKIASVTERHREQTGIPTLSPFRGKGKERDPVEIIAGSVVNAIEMGNPSFIVVPTRSGHTARQIARYRLPIWLFAISSSGKTCSSLQFSYGVVPVFREDHPKDWTDFARELARENGIEGKYALLTEGPSPAHPHMNHRMEIIPL